jgi:hypothetical protein
MSSVCAETHEGNARCTTIVVKAYLSSSHRMMMRALYNHVGTESTLFYEINSLF